MVSLKFNQQKKKLYLKNILILLKGEPGLQGVEGLKGERGRSGPEGNIGERGPKGIKGDRGFPGLVGGDGITELGEKGGIFITIFQIKFLRFYQNFQKTQALSFFLR